MRKADRHLLIKQLINNHTIRTQEELLKLLEQHGVTATQATISRDIRDLKIIKSPDEKGQGRFEIFQGKNNETEDREEQQRLIRMIEDVVIKIDRVQFLSIITTSPDSAQLISAMLDDVEMPEKVTTLAGYDTVIIISRTDADAEKVQQFFQNHMLS